MGGAEQARSTNWVDVARDLGHSAGAGPVIERRVQPAGAKALAGGADGAGADRSAAAISASARRWPLAAVGQEQNAGLGLGARRRGAGADEAFQVLAQLGLEMNYGMLSIPSSLGPALQKARTL